MPLSTWLAVLAEVKQQVAHAAKEESKANGSWVDLAEDTSASPSHEKVTQRWQQQQWQNAFEVLVCPSDVAREFALGATQPFRPLQLFIDVPPFGFLQIFEAPPASIPAEEQDDLLFFVYLEAYQVHLAAHIWHEQSLVVQLDAH